MDTPKQSGLMQPSLRQQRPLTVEDADHLTLDELLILLEADRNAESITLCGSSRYGWAFNAVNRYFTQQGLIGLSRGDVISSDADLCDSRP